MQKGIIKQNVVIMYPDNVTEDQIDAILKQSLEEFTLKRRNLGGLVLETNGVNLVVYSYEKTTIKDYRVIPGFFPVEETVKEEPEQHLPEESTLVPMDALIIRGAIGGPTKKEESMIQKIMSKFHLGK